MISKLSLPLLFQYWLEKEKKIRCPAHLPKEPVIPCLAKMLEPAPYKEPEKKATRNAKGVRSGPRRKGTSSRRPKTRPIPSPPKTMRTRRRRRVTLSPDGGTKKRAASATLEAEAPKRGKGSLADKSAWDVEDNPERRPPC